MARGAALPASARTLRRGPGPPAGVAVHFRGRFPAGARGLDHSAVRSLCALRGIHHPRPDGDDPALQRHAVLALHGLRPRDGQHANPAGEPAVELVRFALYAQVNWVSLAVVCGCTFGFMFAAILAYDPARGVLARRGAPGGEP